MSRQISRDPFARTELHSETVDYLGAGRTGCWYCDGLNGYGKLFQYRQESDGGRVSHIQGKFCSITCMRAYHNVD